MDCEPFGGIVSITMSQSDETGRYVLFALLLPLMLM